MRVVAFACVLAVAAASPASGTAAVPTPPPKLPPCTTVVVSVVDPVDSATAKAGDFFRFKSVGAAVANNRVIIPSGTIGYGIVTLAVPAARSRGGALGLEPLYFQFPNGAQIHVVRDHRPNTLNSQGSNGNLPGFLGAVPLPGVGLVLGAINSMKKGHNVTIPAGVLASVFASDSPATAKCQSTPVQ